VGSHRACKAVAGYFRLWRAGTVGKWRMAIAVAHFTAA